MARRPAATDGLLALIFGAAMQVEVSFVDAPTADLLAARASLLVLAVALAFRRIAPVICMAVGIVVTIVLERLDQNVDENLVATFFATLILAYSIGAHAEGRRLWAGVAVLVVGCLAAMLLDRPPGGADDLLFLATIIIAGPVLLGRLVRSRVRLNQALEEKAAALEQDRAARAADAVTGERERIAGELHHVVSEALASMVGQAGTAEELSRARPDGAEAAFAAVEETGREALGEIRRLLGVLRREDEELALAPQPSLAHLADLVARAHASGLAVELDVEGERSPLPAGVDLTAYRLVQEALGGALEAPDARRAAVRVRYAGDELALEVTDDGESPPAGDRPLLGMRERVALYGGDLVAGRVGGSGYAVRARLPLERAA
jgi:signal transduction histidine kinase